MNGSGPLTVGELRRLKNFGLTSLPDFLFTVENFLQELTRRSDVADSSRSDSDDTVSDSAESTTDSPDDQRPWDTVGKVLSPLFAAAAEFYGTTTLADALDPRITRLASAMGVLDSARAVSIESLVDGEPLLSTLATGRAARLYDTLPEAGRTIVDHRILASPPKTLEKVGAFLGMTRERVRQIQAGIEAKLAAEIGSDVQVMVMVAKDLLGPVARETEVDRSVRKLSPDATPSGALVRQAIRAKLAYHDVNGVRLDAVAAQVVEDIQTASRSWADDAGLIDEQRILQSLPDEKWLSYWPLLRTCCKFHDLFGSLALRDSVRARVKAALLSIGQPATRERVAAVSGVSPDQAGACLSSLPSVVKADKTRWGITSWVDDEYDGIVGEILQRIEAGGGIATMSKILEEIPRKFGVSEFSVRAFLQTPKFVVGDGSVTVADGSSIQLRALDDVIDGRDEQGAPYWIFTVQERHCNGNSLTGVPPEFANAFGCPPDGMVRVRVSNPVGCRDLAVRWRLASVIGATIGYIAEPLRCLDARPGQRVRIVISNAGDAALTAESGRVADSSS